MTNEQLAEQFAALQARLEAVEAENAELKKNPRPAGGVDFGKAVRVQKTNGKIMVRYRTEIELHVLQAVLLAVKMKDIMDIAKKARSGKWTREIAMKPPKKGSDKEPQRQPFDNLFIVTEDNERIAAGTVPLAKKADNSIDTNWESPANKANLKDRIDRWNQLWKDLEDRAKAR